MRIDVVCLGSSNGIFSDRGYTLVTQAVPPSPQGLGICLEEYQYPYPVRFLSLTNDLQPVTMAYMDVPPKSEPSEKTVLLMHGKAFGGYYFRMSSRH